MSALSREDNFSKSLFYKRGFRGITRYNILSISPKLPLRKGRTLKAIKTEVNASVFYISNFRTELLDKKSYWRGITSEDSGKFAPSYFRIQTSAVVLIAIPRLSMPTRNTMQIMNSSN